jgi:GTP pyrophosphokinase/guanosine-3',5'-bis(diphosphate) 3'-pyrophosphohydrolase
MFPGRKENAEADTAARDLISDDKARLYVRGRGLTAGVTLHFGSCCSPLPGDRIVGILQPEKGVDVHAIDCERLGEFENEQDRWIDLGWTAEANARSVGIGRVIATVDHTPGALAEIAGAVGRSNGNITGVRIVRRAHDFFDMAFDVEVLDARHLSHIVAAMRACASVVSADRARASDLEEPES